MRLRAAWLWCLRHLDGNAAQGQVVSNATPPAKPLTPEQQVKLREHVATRPPVQEPDPDREVNLARFDESCEFYDRALSQCGVPLRDDMLRTRLRKRGYSCP